VVSIALGLGAASGLVATFALAPTGGVAVWVVVALLVLAVAATQRVAIFGDETAINSSMVILSAAAATTAAGGPLWLPAVCGLAAGLHWDHVRNRAFRKLVVNTSCTTVAALAAAELGRRPFVAGVPEWLAIGLGAILAVVTYWAVNNCLIAIVLWSADGGSLRRHVKDLTRSETELLPLAALGFVAGYWVLRGLGTWEMVLVLVGLLLVADRVMVRRIGAGSAWRIAGTVTVAAGILVAVGVSAEAASTERFPATAGLLILGLLGALGSVVLVHVRPAIARAASVMAGSAAVVALHSGYPALGPLVVILAAGAPLMSQPRRKAARRRQAISIALEATALVSATVFLPSGFVSSIGGSSIAGLVAGFAALTGWHLSMALEAFHETGVECRVALDLVRSDLLLFVGGGGVGGLVGWIGLHAGVAYMGGALAAAMLVVGVRFRWTRVSGPPSTIELSDNDVLDVVRSAVLGLPASRLPDD